jgi:hypothetical protein
LTKRQKQRKLVDPLCTRRHFNSMAPLLIATILIATSAGGAAPFSSDDRPPPQVMIDGIGSKSCQHWLSTSALKSEGETWALGFWSALNYVAAVTKEQNQLTIGPDEMLNEIAKTCSQRPSDTLANSVWITFLTLNKR